jgi:hypothetical protein
MVEERFTRYCPTEYEYRFTEYEYDLPEKLNTLSDIPPYPS